MRYEMSWIRWVPISLMMLGSVAACGGSDDATPLDNDVDHVGDVDDGDAGADPDVADPDAEGSDDADPDVVDPDADDPDATDPDVANADATDPDATDPDATDPDATDPDATDPDATDPDAADASGPHCGDGVVEGGEACDGDDLNDQTCATLGFAYGRLACRADCTLDADGCDDVPVCGDGLVEGDETCDDGNRESGDGCDESCQVECPDGFYLDGEACEDIDECALSLDDCDALVTCENTAGGFTCGSCPSGYDDVNEDGTQCEDIDECALSLDDCDALVTCENTAGGFTCGSCPLGYRDVHGDGTSCASLFEEAPEDAHQCYVWGTSHMRTFDGLAYDLQGAGEWLMAGRAAAPEIVVQIRQEPLPENGLAAMTTAVTALVGDSEIAIHATGESVDVWIDRVQVTILEAGSPLSGGSIHPVDETIVVVWDAGYQARVTPIGAARLDVEVYLPPELRDGAMRGICGDGDGVALNDVRPRDDAPMLPPIEARDLYVAFVHTWRVDDETSLFVYETEESAADFFDADFPAQFLEGSDLADEDRALYAPNCVDALLGHEFLDEACILDAWWTDMSQAIDGARRVQDPELILALSKPLLFANWRQQGDLANGNWNLSPDFSAVQQTINGDPTMFVSPNSYINVLIEGTIQVATTADDDMIGFVFGYRAPLHEEGSPTRVFDTYLFDWKQANQTFGGNFAAAGMVLSRVLGDFSSSYVPFWTRVDGPGWEVLAEDLGPSRGWGNNVVNEFRLLHTPHRVDIWMNGDLIFREAGSFQSGRFGFYNYSQPQVRYADFTVTDIDADALCGDGYLDVGEECDDGNREDGDGCSSTCRLEDP